MFAKSLILPALALAALAASGLAPATAEFYPSRPITMIVPFPAGGPTDALGRIVAERMRQALGQSVVIENVSAKARTSLFDVFCKACLAAAMSITPAV